MNKGYYLSKETKRTEYRYVWVFSLQYTTLALSSWYQRRDVISCDDILYDKWSYSSMEEKADDASV